MKTILRNAIINAIALFVLSQLFSGVQISGGIITYILGGIALSIMVLVLRPILNLIALPLNLLTFGLFSFLINAIILYILTIFIPQIGITAFVFKGFSFSGFTIPQISFNAFFAYLVSAFVLSILVSFVEWIIKK